MIYIAPRPTLSEFFEQTYLPLRMVGRSSDTLEIYRVALKRWTAFSGTTPINRIDAMLLAGFQAGLLSRISPASVNCYLRSIKAMLRAAADEDVALIDRAPKIRMLKEPKRVPLALTVEEFSSVLAESARWPREIGGSPAADWWRAVLLTDWETGLRYKALLSILSADFLPQSGGLSCRAETQKNRLGQWFDLPAPTISAIQAVYRPEERLLFHPGVRPETVERWFRQILDRSGIHAPKGCGNCFHRFRRSKASYTEAGGGDAQRALGHSTRAVTERYFDPRIVRPSKAHFMPSVRF